MVQVWKIAPGEGAEDWDLFRKHGCIGIGWLTGSDYRQYRSENEVLAALNSEYDEGVKGCGAGAAKMIWRFVHEVKIHQLVVANDGYNGVVGIGVVASDYLSPRSHRNPIRKDKTTHRHHVRRVDWLITDPIELPGKQFFVQSTLWPLKNEKFDTIRQTYNDKYPRLKPILDQVRVGYQAGVSGLSPDEVADVPSMLEGAVSKISVNAYERSPEARKKCIAIHGTNCSICGFSFGAVYGSEAEGYIHVHHLRALCEANGEYEVDPKKDLRPVCPNCHAVLHLGGQCRKVKQVRKMIEDNMA